MLKRAVAHRVPFAWGTGDSIYGDDRSLRLWLEDLPKGYVLAVSAKESLAIGTDRERVSELVAGLPAQGWGRRSAGHGAKGPRWYDWYRRPLNDPRLAGWKRWLAWCGAA